jgi:hypothetical protein
MTILPFSWRIPSRRHFKIRSQWGVAVAPVVGAWTPRAHGAREGRVRGFSGGALRSWPIVKPLQIKIKTDLRPLLLRHEQQATTH